MNLFLKKWNHFWFREGSARNLKAVRFLLFSGGAVFFTFMRDVHPPTFYLHWDPISFYQLLPGPLSQDSLFYLRCIWLVSSFIAGFGILFRWTSSMAFLTGLIYLGHDYNFGVVYHSHHMYIMSIAILTFSEWLGGWSKQLKSESFSADFHWPVQWVRSYVVYMMLICGLEKLWNGQGLHWAFSESFYLRLLTNPHQPPLNKWILDQPLFVSQIFAFLALVMVELSAPLAFLNRKTGTFYFLMWSVFNLFVTLTYGDHVMFFSQIFCYATFVDWGYFLSRRKA